MRKAYFYLLFVILFWALAPLLIIELSASMTVHQINFLATGITLAVLALALRARGGWKHVREYRGRDWLIMLVLGATGIFPFKTLYYLAISLEPALAGELNILNFTWPVLVVLLSPLLLRERMTVYRILGALVSFAGAALILSRGWSMSFHGQSFIAYLCILAGAVAWSLFSIFTKRTRFEALSATFFYNLSALLCFGVLFALTSPFRMPTLRDWILLLILGGGTTGVGYLFWIMALQVGDTAKVSNAVFLIPFVTLIYLTLLRGDSIRIIQIAALCLIIAGSIVQHLDRRVGPPQG